jgi:hypothetical protein
LVTGLASLLLELLTYYFNAKDFATTNKGTNLFATVIIWMQV